MHELALAQSIVDIAEAQARARPFERLLRIRVRVGALARVEPEALAFGFEAAKVGTVAERAVLDIEPSPGVCRCVECARTSSLERRGDPCPACGSFHVIVTGGEDLRVTELEVE